MAIADQLSHRFEGESVGRALALVGERWTLLILREAFFGVRRFGQFARNLSIPRPTLSARLRTLVDAGLLERVLYARDPDRHEYRLTPAGVDLYPAIVTLMQWGDRHLAGPEGPPIVLRHRACGETADPELTCGKCGKPIGAHNVTPEPGPGFS
jgi:DNA-binding HxlR family transcriptional regulator